MSNSSHAPYPASSAERLALCPASGRAEQSAPPSPENKHSRKGSGAHYMLEVGVANLLRSAQDAYSLAHALGGEYLPEASDIGAVQDALDYVFSILDEHPDAVVHAERRLHFPSEHEPEDVWGTCDITIYIPSTGTLYVIDYKNGAMEVDVFENRQLLRYTCSAVNDEELEGPVHKAVAVIVQPNAFSSKGPIREWELSPLELMGWQAKLDEEIHASQDPDAPFVPGEKQCHYCRAKVTCAARQTKALAVVGATFKDVKTIDDLPSVSLPDPRHITPERLAYILDASSFLKGWLRDCAEYAHEQARLGVMIPGKKLVNKDASRKWHGPDDEIAQALIDMSNGGLTLDDVMPRSLVALTTAEKLLVNKAKEKAPRGKKKKAAEEARTSMAFLTLKDVTGATVLVDENDKRPAINAAQQHFGTVNIGNK